MQYTALGAVVNLASRIENLNKLYGTQMTIEVNLNNMTLVRRRDYVAPKVIAKSLPNLDEAWSLTRQTIVNAVNFPGTRMTRAGQGRICVTNRNVPNMIGQLSHVLGVAGLNIAQMHNASKGDYAYASEPTQDDLAVIGRKLARAPWSGGGARRSRPRCRRCRS